MVIESSLLVFAVGCMGGMLAELLHWWNLRTSLEMPAYKSNPFYWGITFSMVLASGLLAWLYFGDEGEGIIVLHIGVATPLILQKLVTTVPKQENNQNMIASSNHNLRKFFTW